ncbi:Nuclear factor erythroid 2-related factor 3 [Heterocephalus glaber]|uniref:Nuclear factor erythroid 2-related factor 3 n=1 Tax=Heterocephalus glaber TaxID=10181 RepID=G5BD42_HETGA|nr:Nuclear factor erythroid 2-related factor 3 [Heterocephalus glaber]
MKLLKSWGATGGGLLHLTVLLSLAGLRVDLDLDLYLLPPPALLRDELRPPGGPARPAHALSPFPTSGGWGGAGPLHPKARELDFLGPLEGHLLWEVRALGVPFIPRTRVDAWLVHSVADRDADGTHGLLGATASSAGGVGAGVDGGSQAAPGGGGDPLAAEEEEEKAAAEPTAQVAVSGGRASQENEVLREKCESVARSSRQEENETESSQEKSLQQQNNEDKNKTADESDWEVAKTTESRKEGVSLEDTPFQSTISDGMNSSAHNVNLSQAVSHDVNLHEAMLLSPNTFRRDPVTRTSQTQEPFLQTLPGTNLTEFHPPADNQMRNLTSQDLLYGLDANIFDEINLLSLAVEGFAPMEVSFQEPDSDSGLSLNLSHNTSITKSNSYSTCNEDAVSYTSDLKNLSGHDLEGAVGGYCPEHSMLCHMDHSYEAGFQDLVFHNHTYHLQPGVPEPTSQSFSTSGKSQKMNRYFNNTDKNLSRDERRAKALRIPFSVEEIIRMPVDSFNSMLSRHYLTDLQVSLMRDIRRRGKNKVAAQNCRKRKLDIILNLEGEVCNLQARKKTLEREQAQYNKAINIMKQKLNDLYHVFSRLSDDQGRPVNPDQYILQCSHDGTVFIVPKELVAPGQKETQKEREKKQKVDGLHFYG